MDLRWTKLLPSPSACLRVFSPPGRDTTVSAFSPPSPPSFFPFSVIALSPASSSSPSLPPTDLCQDFEVSAARYLLGQKRRRRRRRYMADKTLPPSPLSSLLRGGRAQGREEIGKEEEEEDWEPEAGDSGSSLLRSFRLSRRRDLPPFLGGGGGGRRRRAISPLPRPKSSPPVVPRKRTRLFHACTPKCTH